MSWFDTLVIFLALLGLVEATPTAKTAGNTSLIGPVTIGAVGGMLCFCFFVSKIYKYRDTVLRKFRLRHGPSSKSASSSCPVSPAEENDNTASTVSLVELLDLPPSRRGRTDSDEIASLQDFLREVGLVANAKIDPRKGRSKVYIDPDEETLPRFLGPRSASAPLFRTAAEWAPPPTPPPTRPLPPIPAYAPSECRSALSQGRTDSEKTMAEPSVEDFSKGKYCTYPFRK